MNVPHRTDATAPVADDAATETIAGRLARFAVATRFEDLPAAVVERAKLHVLDCLGIGLASTTFDFGLRALSAIEGMSGPGPATVIGRSAGAQPRDAVLANGTLIHGLDFDDTHSGGVVHASASMLPVALALAETRGLSGRDLILAYLLGIEASARIGMAAKGGFHQIGFHPTGMVNVFGACLTAGRLSGAPAGAIAAAQGIALSMASGSLEFLSDGAWTKRLHPGLAGMNAMMATELARAGFKAPSAPYEGRFGLFSSYLGGAGDADLSLATAGLGEAWEMERVALKPFPACHFNHAFADAAIALRDKHGLAPEDVKAIRARIGEGQVKVVCEPEAAKRRPANAYEAQFSVHYAIAASLAHGRFTLDELEPAAYGDPRLHALMDRISYEVDPHSRFPAFYSGEIVVETMDGRVLTHREDVNRGAEGRPLGMQDVAEKFASNAGRVLSPTAAERIADLALSLDRLDDVAPLARALSTR